MNNRYRDYMGTVWQLYGTLNNQKWNNKIIGIKSKQHFFLENIKRA